jgi:glutathione transport system ATP-binding protein
MIAMAIANDPDVIIADEPTTALDVTIQAQVLDVLKLAQKETGAAVIMITHDLGVVAGIADRVQVMYAGRSVETGTVDDVYHRPRMPYTIGLLGSVPRLDEGEKRALVPIEGNPPSPLHLPPGCKFAPRCPMVIDACNAAEPELLEVDTPDHWASCIRSGEVAVGSLGYRDIYVLPELAEPPAARLPREQRTEVLRIDGLVKEFPLTKGAVFKKRIGTVHAVDGVDLDIREGETVGLVGESGCGKTTTLLQILDLVKPQQGQIAVLGKTTDELKTRAQRKAIRRDLQVVFQDPMASLDPRLPVFDVLAEPLRAHGVDKQAVAERVDELLRLVGLEPSHANRYPQHFSGGQRQRIGIARALALEPRLIVLDEPVAALDVSIQAGVINLLLELRAELGLSYLFVAHDLAVVRHIADRVAVMYLGRIVEIGDVDAVFDSPTHPYTQALLSAVPIPDPDKERTRTRIILKGDLPSPLERPSGCRFRTRCPKFLTLTDGERQRCIDDDPRLLVAGEDHESACHYQEAVSVF